MRIRQPAGIGRNLDRLALVGVLSLALAACGGTASGATTTTAPTADPVSAAPAEPTTAPQPTAGTTTVQVDREAWFAGFHLTFGAANAEITPGRGGVVTIETAFENTGDEDARLDATLNLASAGENAREAMAMDIPSVPGGLTAKGVLAFDVEDTFTFDDAVLTLGRSGNQQAIVPLIATAGEAVTREPVAVTASGGGQAGDLRIDLDGGELRADSPWKHGQMEDGSLVLTMTYSATFDSGFAGGFAFTAENVALRLPDGTTVGVIQDGRSQSIELIGPNATVKDLYSRFEIDDPAAGDYAFLVRSFDGAEDEIAFIID